MRLSTTKPGTILKKHFPVKTKQWDKTKPSFLEANTIAHYGDSAAGMFIYTINMSILPSHLTSKKQPWARVNGVSFYV